ncbi:SMI1/KNR4 family protein [Bacillus sp. DX4.1]|uniref:SMI1/KNR4 family protein n=1 Tax=Bacillus sp. DX4.1 TaxID=3055867 RepID=UPI00259FEA99|nr:SMI1/KNR4 family protein [Bacillus sp. DX4.1]MDM5186248.1 SMI1/KNR4 family protein [Bacillus sp. DX4.1]
MSHIEWDNPDKLVSMECVQEVAKKIGVHFPQDYIKCVLENNGASVEPEAFDVKGIERVFGSLLSYDENRIENILKVYENYKGTLPSNVIPFAIDPSGNLICFDYKNQKEDPIVVFWEHEGAWEKEALMEREGITAEEAEEVARENVFYVANTFTELLNKLHD